MSKFKFLILHGIRKRIFKKSFIITNAVLGLIIMGLVNIPAIISLFESEDEIEPTKVMIVNDTTDDVVDLESELLTYFNAPYEEARYVVYEGTLENFDDFWEQKDVEILLVFSGDLNQPDIDVYIKDQSQNNFILSSIQAFLNDYQGIEYPNYTFVEAPDTGEPSDDLDPETRMFIEGIITIIVLPVFILILMTTQFLGVDIIEEKSSKAIETIISSVPSRLHFLSKIITNLTFLVVQALILFLFGLIGLLISRLLQSGMDIETASLLAELAERVPNWPLILTFLILFMIVGTLFFLTLAALIAAIATTQEDYQQFQAPLVFTLLGGFYIAIFLPIIGVDSLLRVFAYIPIFSTLVAPVAYATGIIGLAETIFVFVLLIIFTGLFMRIISPIYRVAILSYEETKFFKRIKFYVKKAFAKNGKKK